MRTLSEYIKLLQFSEVKIQVFVYLWNNLIGILIVIVSYFVFISKISTEFI